LELTEKKLVKCRDRQCEECSKNYSECTVCNNSNGFYLRESDAKCYSVQTALPGTGLDAASNRMVSCTDGQCKDCSANHSHCVACNQEAGYYLIESRAACFNETNMPDTYGVKPGTGYAVNCNDKNCVKCVSDYTRCDVCNTSVRYYRWNYTCINSTQFPYKHGVLVDKGWVEPCKPCEPTKDCKPIEQEHCIDCITDTKVCKACDTANQYLLQGNTCIHVNNIPDLFGADWSSQPAKPRI